MESPTLGFKELPGYFDVDSGKNYNHDDNEINWDNEGYGKNHEMVKIMKRMKSVRL